MKRFFGKRLGAKFWSPKTVCCSFTKWLPTKIQPVITSLSADKFRWQPALRLSAKPGVGLFMCIGVDHLTFEGEGRLFLKKYILPAYLYQTKIHAQEHCPKKNLHTHSVSQKGMLHEAKTVMHTHFLRKKFSLCKKGLKNVSTCTKLLTQPQKSKWSSLSL